MIIPVSLGICDSMSDDSSQAESSLEEQLVAYLDGELDADAGRRIEELLAGDPRLRQTLQQLDRTWELLGELEKPDVEDRFTQTTLEMVTAAAAEDVRRSQAALPRRRRRRWAIVGGSLAAAALAAFLAVALFAPDPNRQLADDLPLLENIEQYGLLVNPGQNRQIDAFEFLRMLSQEGLFVEEDGDER